MVNYWTEQLLNTSPRLRSMPPTLNIMSDPQVVSLPGLCELRHTRSCSPAQRSNEKLMVAAVRVVKVDGVPLSCKVDQLLISV